MTQSIPGKSKSTSDEVARYQRLMELVEAEDASQGEVGCGGNRGKRISEYFSTSGIIFDDEKLTSLLREHLGHILNEPDFDSITSQIQRQIESVIVPSFSHPLSSSSLSASVEVTEHIPTDKLKALFQSQIAEFCSENILEQLVDFSHHIINKAALNPRHTWSKPIWVFRGETQIYIVQAAGMEEAIAKVKLQHPQEIGNLEVIRVGGVLAPDQVIALDKSLL